MNLWVPGLGRAMGSRRTGPIHSCVPANSNTPRLGSSCPDWPLLCACRCVIRTTSVPWKPALQASFRELPPFSAGRLRADGFAASAENEKSRPLSQFAQSSPDSAAAAAGSGTPVVSAFRFYPAPPPIVEAARPGQAVDEFDAALSTKTERNNLQARSGRDKKPRSHAMRGNARFRCSASRTGAFDAPNRRHTRSDALHGTLASTLCVAALCQCYFTVNRWFGASNARVRDAERRNLAFPHGRAWERGRLTQSVGTRMVAGGNGEPTPDTRV